VRSIRILVTGAGGLLGGRLASLFSAQHSVTTARHVAPGPSGLPSVALDLLEPSSIAAALDTARPEAVLHCAALADADRCEREPALAAALNERACAALGRECQARLVALSTDLVFDGRRSPVSEDDAPAPLLLYARTKLAGEEAVLAEARGSAVVRVALIVGRGFGPRGSASESIAWALRAGRPLRLFTDQYRTPVDPDSIAAATLALCAGSGTGRYHLGGPERVSRYELGLRTAAVLGLPTTALTPITQADAPGAPRPADVSFDSSRAQRELAYRPRPLAEAIRDGRPQPDIIASA
jgi:dTDP-4-dehydrorhamnose reductase